MNTTTLLASLALLAVNVIAAGKPDVGGPHGVQGLWKQDTHLVHRRHHSRQEHKRHVKRAKGKGNGKCGSTSSSNSKPAPSNDNGNQNNGPSSSNDSGNDSSDNSASSSANSTASSDSGSSSSSSSSSASLSGISGFTGSNSGIGSWFRTNNGNDDTNGRSWCQLNYQDSWMGFAPDVSVMLSNFGSDITKAGTAYCGLEAKATNPNNGKSALIYIVDGFDPKWVRTPGSIDLTLAAFAALYESTDDKNVVIQNLQWEFTGNRNSAYAFNSGS